MKFTKKLTIGSMLLISAFTLIACKNGDSAQNESKEIVFWNPNSGADRKIMQEMVNDYNATNPEFKIKNTSFKENDMYAKIPAAVYSGKGVPDLTIVHAERLKRYQESGMLENMDSHLDKFPEIKEENYVPEAWQQGTLDGGQYAVPLDIHNWGTYYNKELVEKYAPHVLDDNIITTAEIEASGELAKKDGIQAIGYGWIKPNYMGFLKQKGGNLTENGIDPTLDSSESKAAMQVMADHYKAGITSKDGQIVLTQFMSGKMVFMPEGIWMYKDVEQANFDWGLTNAPQISDDPKNTVNWASSHQFVMFKSESRSDAKEEGIMDFLDWLRVNSDTWGQAGMNPASLKAQEDPEYKKLPQYFFVSTPENQSNLNIFNFKFNGYVSDFVDAHGADVVFGKNSAAEFTKAMQKEVEGKIEQAQ